MSTKTRVLFTDDLDGTDAIGTIRFALDGQGYEIDLSTAHDAELRDTLARYITVARRTSQQGRNGRGRGRVARQPDPIEQLAVEHRAQVRAWALNQPDLKVSERGRLSLAIIAAYDAAHAGSRS